MVMREIEWAHGKFIDSGVTAMLTGKRSTILLLGLAAQFMWGGLTASAQGPAPLDPEKIGRLLGTEGTKFMHIAGTGEVDQPAPAVRKAIEKVQEIRKAAPEPPKGFGHAALSTPSAVTAAPLAKIFEQAGDEKDGMVKFTFGRDTKAGCGCKLGSAMGVNTWASFVGKDDQAFVDGDFACLPGELQPTLKALRKAGINIVAIHNHMEDESPRVIFLHYWGVGPASDLAKGVKAALAAQAALDEKQRP
jgi:hypothetical protein